MFRSEYIILSTFNLCNINCCHLANENFTVQKTGCNLCHGLSGIAKATTGSLKKIRKLSLRNFFKNAGRGLTRYHDGESDSDNIMNFDGKYSHWSYISESDAMFVKIDNVITQCRQRWKTDISHAAQKFRQFLYWWGTALVGKRYTF